MQQGAFDPVVDGCEGVFHTASPILPRNSISDPQVHLLASLLAFLYLLLLHIYIYIVPICHNPLLNGLSRQQWEWISPQ